MWLPRQHQAQEVSFASAFPNLKFRMSNVLRLIEVLIEVLTVLFGNALGLEVEQQIIAPTRLRVGARHVEPAKRMNADHGTGDLAIEVQIANMEIFAGAFQALRVV